MKLIHHITHEHKDLLPHIEHLKEAADTIGSATEDVVRHELDAAHHFLAHQLIPHAVSEDKALYPLVARYMGSTGATDMMSYEHEQVGALTQQLGKLMTEAKLNESALRSVLYSLHALVLLHFNKEEKFFLPVLQDSLTPEDDEVAAAAMHEAHHHAH
jgi:hemerythrin-like domain-containing protein